LNVCGISRHGWTAKNSRPEQTKSFSSARHKPHINSIPPSDYDLNTAEALAAVFEYIREANIAMDSGEFRFENVNAARDLLERF